MMFGGVNSNKEVFIASEGSLIGLHMQKIEKTQQPDDNCSDGKAERRFLTAVKAGLNTHPKLFKSMTPKGSWCNRRKAAVCKIRLIGNAVKPE